MNQSGDSIRLHSLPQPRCLDCGVDTQAIAEYYMVTEEVWAQAIPEPERHRMCCIGCLEKRLGRRLVPEDFPPYPINRGAFPMGRRLMNRVTGKAVVG